MSKKAFIKVVENAKKRKNEYFVKNFDITESVELLLEEVKKDYKFKKQVELQCGLHTCNETLETQSKKYGKEISKLKEQLADAEEHIDNLELQLREQYQLVDEKDEELELTENALELTCEDLWCMSVWGNTKEEVVKDYMEHFKTKAKDVKSE